MVQQFLQLQIAQALCTGIGILGPKYYIRFFSFCFADLIISCQKISESPFQELKLFLKIGHNLY
jgi:hypothetical protein